MHTRLLTLLLLTMLWQPVFPGSAQSLSQRSVPPPTVTPRSFTHPFMQYFSRRDYDASTQNWTVRQDNRGVVYVGNGQGILEYDGHTWRLIRIDNESTARAIEIAPDNTIYAAGTDALGYLEADSLGLLQYVSLVPHIPEVDRDFGIVWFVHVLPDGVYFQASNHLFKWDGTAMKVWRPTTRFSTSAVVRDTLYVSSYGEGLYRMENAGLQYIPESEPFATEWIFVMLPYDGARTLVGTRDQGFFLFDGLTFTAFPTDVDAFLQIYTLYLPGAVLNDGTFALGTSDAGLLVLDKQGRLIHHIDREKGLPSAAVYNVAPDREQGLWLALNNGIVRIELPAPLSFLDDAAGLNESISTLAYFDGELYAGTRRGLFVVDTLAHAVQKVAGADKTIWNLLATPEALFATTNGGLYRIDRGRKTTAWNLFELSETEEYKAYSLHRAALDPQLLFLGRRDGLDVIRYDPAGPGTWTLVGSVPGIDGQVNTIHERQPGALVLGVDDGVIHLAYTKDAPLAPEQQHHGEAEGLPGGSAWGYEAGGRLFFTTRDGLFMRDASGQAYVRADSLFPGVSFEDAITFGNLADGKNGDLWLAAKEGVYRAQPAGDGTYTVEAAAFLHAAEWTINSIATAEDDVVWLGGIDGLIRFDGGETKDYSAVHAPFIRRVVLGADSVFYGGDGAALPPPDETTPAFDFENNTIRLDYRAPFFDLPARIQYQSTLDGFNEAWSAWSDETWRAYTNLPQGDYTFRVRAKNAYGAVSEPAVYAFSVLPAWWATPWAWAGYVAVIAGVGYLASRGMRKRLIARERLRADREKAEAIAATNEELQLALKHLTEAQDQLIHAEKMASLGQLTAGIAHEIKNPLNFVNNFAAISQEQTDEIKSIMSKYLGDLEGEDALEIKEVLTDLHNNVAKINEHGRRADGIISSMLEHSRTGKGERRPVAINKMVDEYVNLSYHGVRERLNNITIEISRQYDNDAGEVEVTPQEIGRVLINLLDNAFYAVAQKLKVAPKGYVPAVAVKTVRRADSVAIHITDNGIGVSAALREKVFEPFFTTKPTGSGTGLGLSLSHDIVVKGHGGQLFLEGEEGKGVSLVMVLPA